MYHNTSSIVLFLFFFFKQKTAYEMRISDWSSDVCSSDLYKRKVGNAWVDVTAGVFAAQVTAVAKGLIAIGVEQGDRVGLMSATRFEWPPVDYALWAAGGVTVPIYATSAAEPLRWILEDPEALALILEADAPADTVTDVAAAAPALRTVYPTDAP